MEQLLESSIKAVVEAGVTGIAAVAVERYLLKGFADWEKKTWLAAMGLATVAMVGVGVWKQDVSSLLIGAGIFLGMGAVMANNAHHNAGN